MVKVALIEAVPLAPTVDAPAGVTVAVPMVLLPSLKVTLPVGPCALLLCELIAIDKVTAWFAGTGFAATDKTADVLAGVTMTVSFSGVVTGL